MTQLDVRRRGGGGGAGGRHGGARGQRGAERPAFVIGTLTWPDIKRMLIIVLVFGIALVYVRSDVYGGGGGGGAPSEPAHAQQQHRQHRRQQLSSDAAVGDIFDETDSSVGRVTYFNKRHGQDDGVGRSGAADTRTRALVDTADYAIDAAAAGDDDAAQRFRSDETADELASPIPLFVHDPAVSGSGRALAQPVPASQQHQQQQRQQQQQQHTGRRQQRTPNEPAVNLEQQQPPVPEAEATSGVGGATRGGGGGGAIDRSDGTDEESGGDGAVDADDAALLANATAPSPSSPQQPPHAANATLLSVEHGDDAASSTTDARTRATTSVNATGAAVADADDTCAFPLMNDWREWPTCPPTLSPCPPPVVAAASTHNATNAAVDAVGAAAAADGAVDVDAAAAVGAAAVTRAAWSSALTDFYRVVIRDGKHAIEAQFEELAHDAKRAEARKLQKKAIVQRKEQILDRFLDCMDGAVGRWDVVTFLEAVHRAARTADGGTTVTMTFVSDGYEAQLDTFIAHLTDANGERVASTVVMCFDAPAIENCRQYESRGVTCAMAPRVKHCQDLVAKVDELTEELTYPPGGIWISRTIVNHLLLCAGVDVIVSDLDALWTRAVLPPDSNSDMDDDDDADDDTGDDGGDGDGVVDDDDDDDDGTLALIPRFMSDFEHGTAVLFSAGQFPKAISSVWGASACLGWQYWTAGPAMPQLVWNALLVNMEFPSDQWAMNWALFRQGVEFTTPYADGRGVAVTRGGGGADVSIVFVGAPYIFRSFCFTTTDAYDDAYVQHCQPRAPDGADDSHYRATETRRGAMRIAKRSAADVARVRKQRARDEEQARKRKKQQQQQKKGGKQRTFTLFGGAGVLRHPSERVGEATAAAEEGVELTAAAAAAARAESLARRGLGRDANAAAQQKYKPRESGAG